MFVADAHFIAEVESLINEWERLLYASESWDKHFDLASFRFLHTLKGSAALFGFSALAETAHHLESFFEKAQAPHSLTQAEKAFFLSAVSHFRYLLHHEPLQGADAQSHAAFLQKIVYHKKGLHKKEITSYWIHYQPSAKTARVGIKPHLHLEDLQAIEAELVFFEIAPPEATQEWIILLATKLKADELRNIFLFLTDECRLDILPIQNPASPQTAFHLFEYPQMRQFLQDYFTQEDKTRLRDFTTFQKALLDFLQPHLPTNVETALPTQKDPTETSAFLRLSLSEIDEMSLLIAESLADLKNLDTKKVEENLILLQKKIKNWQYDSLNKLKQKCEILIHNLSQEALQNHTLPQAVRLEWQADPDLKLHKAHLKGLGEIFLHLIRNSFAHAFVEEKTKEPLITILFQSNPAEPLLIQYRDNGTGINIEKIRQKALELQLFSPEALEKMDTQSLVSLIFQDRFSTQAAEKLSHLAGRGIGMGIIKSQMEKMGCQYRLLLEKEGGFGLEIVLNM
jgi:two-component system chemotaxis sensor kinase CheA